MSEAARRSFDRVRFSRSARPVLAALIFAAVAIGFFNPIFRSSATFSVIAGHQSIQFPWAAHPTGFPDSVQSDQANYVYPIETDVDRSLGRGLLPTWTRSSFLGLPTAGSVYSAMAYPGHIILLALVSPSWAHDLFLLLHVWLAGLGMYLLLRVLGRSWFASMFGGVTWMLCPAWFGLIQLEGNAAFAALLPLALAAGLVGIRRRSAGALVTCGVLQALLILGASIQNGVFCLLLVGAAMTCDQQARQSPDGWFRHALRNLRLALPANALGLLLTGFVLVPSQAAISDSRRSPIPYDELVGTMGMSLHRLGDAISPSVPRPVTGNTIWTLLFLGSVAGVLALLGILSRQRGAWIGRTTVLVFGLLLTGSPLALIAYHVVPGFGYISPLGRLTPYIAFGAVILAASGADMVLGLVRRIGGSRALVAVATLTTAATALQVWQLATFDRAVNPPFQPRSAPYLYPRTPMLDSLTTAARATAAKGGTQRILLMRKGSGSDPFFPPPLYGDVSLVFSLESTGGYFNVIPPRSASLVRVLGGTPPADAVQPTIGAFATSFFAAQSRFDLTERLGIDTVVTVPRAFPDPALRKGLAPLGARVAYSGSDGAVYDLPRALPRAFFVRGSETVPDEQRALERYLEPAFPYRSTVLLDDSRPAARVASSSPELPARIVSQSDDHLRIRVDAPAAGWVVVLESYAAGWSAHVNGRSTPISRADYAFRAVRVPRGVSTIDMHYDPPGLISGIAISLLGVLAAVAALVVPRWRRRRRPAAQL